MNSSVVLHGEEMDFLSAVYGVSRVSWKLLLDFISQQGSLGELRAELAPQRAAGALQRAGEMLQRHFPGIPGTDGAVLTPGWAEPVRNEDPAPVEPTKPPPAAFSGHGAASGTRAAAPCPCSSSPAGSCSTPLHGAACCGTLLTASAGKGLEAPLQPQLSESPVLVLHI